MRILAGKLELNSKVGRPTPRILVLAVTRFGGGLKKHITLEMSGGSGIRVLGTLPGQHVFWNCFPMPSNSHRRRVE